MSPQPVPRLADVLRAFEALGEACEAETWLKQIQKIMEIIRIAEQYRVSLAAHQLVGEADNWWDTVHNLRIVIDLTRAEFEQLFLVQFFPPALKYVPAIANDNRMKKQRFMEGLRDSIRCELRSDIALSYNETIAATYAIEADEVAHPRCGDGQGSSHPRRNRWAHRRKPRGGNSQGYTSSSSSSGSSRRWGLAPYTCFACGQPRNTKIRCPFVNNSQGAFSGSGFQNPRPTQSLSTQISPAPYRQPNHTQQHYRPPQPLAANRGRNRGGRNQGGRGQLHAITGGDTTEAPGSSTALAGTILISNSEARVLFDTGASHSFTSTLLAESLRLEPTPLGKVFNFSTPPGVGTGVDKAYRKCQVVIGGQKLQADLFLIELNDFDLILGMDWLSKYRALIDCDRRAVRITPPSKETFKIKMVGHLLPPSSLLKACFRGRRTLACYNIITAGEKANMETNSYVPIVDKYPDMFPKELPGLPPNREVEFHIDRVLGTEPISILPYRMAPAKMSELKLQLEDLESKGFIRKSSSPWGAPVLFVKKHDGTLCLCIDY
ncbi:uncharacterized protein LOC112203900 [Rosa chinensis]|uniref:uncharacterized protein LOC112203900 n=1 Tax=Rosa chinensis TaxID=74649 RepID=UPI000D08B515|nr:uncharacterized protein LOC112203900 [Rosa chinensis]